MPGHVQAKHTVAAGQKHQTRGRAVVWVASAESHQRQPPPPPPAAQPLPGCKKERPPATYGGRQPGKSADHQSLDNYPANNNNDIHERREAERYLVYRTALAAEQHRRDKQERHRKEERLSFYASKGNARVRTNNPNKSTSQRDETARPPANIAIAIEASPASALVTVTITVDAMNSTLHRRQRLLRRDRRKARRKQIRLRNEAIREADEAEHPARPTHEAKPSSRLALGPPPGFPAKPPLHEERVALEPQREVLVAARKPKGRDLKRIVGHRPGHDDQVAETKNTCRPRPRRQKTRDRRGADGASILKDGSRTEVKSNRTSKGRRSRKRRPVRSQPRRATRTSAPRCWRVRHGQASDADHEN